MKALGKHSGAKPPAARRQRQTAPLTGLAVLDALRSWVLPAVAVTAAVALFVVYNIGLLDAAPAVTAIGLLALALVLFFGLRSFTEQSISGRLGILLAAFVVVWSAATSYPFYRALNPGEPAFSAELQRNSGPVTLPLQGKPGRYSLLVQGHFPPAEGKQNRTATYRLTVGHEGVAEQVLEGTFHQEWRSQRIGAGRRSSLVPVMTQSTQVLNSIDDPDGRDLILTLTDLSAGLSDTLTVKLYAERVTRLVLVGLGVLAVAGAVLIDAYRPAGASEGLMGTLTLATLVSIVVFRTSSTVAPGFPQFVVAALVGTLAGALGGSLLWRLTRALNKRLPAGL
jgi:hypothetical protein